MAPDLDITVSTRTDKPSKGDHSHPYDIARIRFKSGPVQGHGRDSVPGRFQSRNVRFDPGRRNRTYIEPLLSLMHRHGFSQNRTPGFKLEPTVALNLSWDTGSVWESGVGVIGIRGAVLRGPT